MSTVALHSSTSDSENDPSQLYAFWDIASQSILQIAAASAAGGATFTSDAASANGGDPQSLRFELGAPAPTAKSASNPSFSEETASAAANATKLFAAHIGAPLQHGTAGPVAVESSTHSSSGDMPLTVAHPQTATAVSTNVASSAVAAVLASSAAPASVNASPAPNGTEAEVAFLSGMTYTNTVAATSFATWNADNPATFATSARVHKFGGTSDGTAGGTVDYYFDPASGWTAAEQNALVSGLTLWSDIANIKFVATTDASASQLTFKRGTDGSAFENNSETPSAVGSSTIGTNSGTYISIDTSTPGFGPIGAPFTQYGGYAWETLVHEEGHALGLGHAGAYNGNVDSSTQQFSIFDNRLWSVMSYINPDDTAAKDYSG